MLSVLHHHLHSTFIPHEGNGYRPHALHHSALRVYAMVAVLVKVFAILIVATYPAPSTTSNVTPTAIAQLTNKERTRAGLKQLATNTRLGRGAEGKAQDMVTKGYFAHVSPSNASPWYWFKKAGYSYSYAGENLAKDYLTAEDMVRAWMASASHRKNILNSRFKETGIAVTSGLINGFDSLVAVQFFAEPVKQKTTVVQKPQPKPATATTPSPQVIQRQEQPIVLAEEEEPAVPPLPPALTAPVPGDVFTIGQLWIAGTAPANVLVNILRDDVALVSIRSDALGNFRVQLPIALADGTYTITALAVDQATGLTSDLATPVSVTVDATAPTIASDRVVLLPSLSAGRYDLAVPIDGEADRAQVHVGSVTATLIRTEGAYRGVLDARAVPQERADVTVEATDPAGNSATAVLADLSSVQSAILEPAADSPLRAVVNAVPFSQNLLLGLLAFLIVALSLKVFIRIRFQHQPTILYTLLLIYAISVLILL